MPSVPSTISWDLEFEDHDRDDDGDDGIAECLEARSGHPLVLSPIRLMFGEMDAQPLMYSDIARWWPLLSPPEEYVRKKRPTTWPHSSGDTAEQPVERVLELGCGEGTTCRS